jgi:hypothetical protein
MVAEELREFEEAETNYIKALETYIQYDDKHNLGIVLISCKRIYQSHSSSQFLAQISDSLGSSEAEVLQLFESGVMA